MHCPESRFFLLLAEALFFRVVFDCQVRHLRVYSNATSLFDAAKDAHKNRLMKVIESFSPIKSVAPGCYRYRKPPIHNNYSVPSANYSSQKRLVEPRL